MNGLFAKMSKKAWVFIGIGVTAVIAIGVVVAINLLGGDDAYRTIVVYQTEGRVTINREGVGDIEAYVNLMLKSDDNVSVGDNSNLRLKLDDDKFIMVEPNSEFSIVAEGDKTDSKTKIHLTKGAITNEIQGELSGNSSYEVTTPNSIMAVRGTVFRVEVKVDDNEVCYATVQVFDGEVASKLVMPDGKIVDKGVSIKAGQQVVVKKTESDSEYVVGPEQMDYEDLSEDTLHFLLDVLDDGEIICLTKEEIEELLNGEETATQENTSEETTTAEKVLITFLVDEMVYGQQEIEKGGLVTEPFTMPTEAGRWDYDFTVPVTEHIMISWIDESQ